MGQRDPITEYKNEAYDMFSGLVQSVDEDFLRTLMHIQVVVETEPEQTPLLRNVNYSAPSESSIFAGRCCLTMEEARPRPAASPRTT